MIKLTALVKKFRLKFSLPGKSPVVIYDKAGELVLRQFLGPSVQPVVLDIRDVVYLSPKIVLNLALLLVSKKNKSGLWSRAGLRVCYEHALISSLDPDLVINHSEANIRFGLLSRLYRSARFIGVQNGYRQSEINETAPLNYLTNAFCFGQEVIDNYRRAGANIQNFFILGSLSDGLYREAKGGGPEAPGFDICLISQYRRNRFDRETRELAEITATLMNFLGEFCEKHNKSCVIAGNAKKGLEADREREFYKEWLKDPHFVFRPNDRSSFSTYAAIDASNVVICVNSTAGIEALGRGKKLLFSNFSKNQFFDIQGKYKDGVWALSNACPDYEEFEKRLFDLLLLSREEWANVSREFSTYFIFCDEERYPQDVLREHLFGHS